MLIVADENMPLLRETFAQLGEVRTYPGRHLRAEQVADADILLVRSVTQVNRKLLKKSRVKFVGTATIGTDHIDLNYLQQCGIAVASAPGSNANAVVDYVLSALCALDGAMESVLCGKQVGIIGLGNVGSRLLQRLQALGIACIGYDPLLPLSSPLPTADLDTVLHCDVVCCHAPLTHDGDFPTRHLLDKSRLNQLPANAILLNAGRGGVIDNFALKQLLQTRNDVRVVLDVWENEPTIDAELLKLVTLGTPHIAGYSLDGKIAGTRMVFEACCRFLAVKSELPLLMSSFLPVKINVPSHLYGSALTRAAIHSVYDVRVDNSNMRVALCDSISVKVAERFDALRKNYVERREFSACEINNWSEFDVEQKALLLKAGFVAPRLVA
ncbi:MAG: 4-phosphoerythronate dehydrogenase [Verrucomicrobiaceae bacterium]|nr:4-phosphoerythronate dehydrogenase [Verrucomicrobiaceae bacterium]